jgi:hypothetical protein
MSAFGGPNIIDDGLVLYLDAGNRKSYVSGSTTWFDKSGRGNNGTLINGPTFNTGELGSVVFDGTNDYVTKSNPTNFPINSDLSVFCFFRRTGNTSSPPHQCLISTGFGGWNLLLLNQTTLSFNKAFIEGVITGSNILINQWYYVGCTRNGNEFKLYINGLLDSTLVKSISFNDNNKYELGTDSGASGNNNSRNAYLNGNISLTQVYSRALSAQEVLQNYNATKGRFGL